jgi:hypothetical protein
VRALGETFFLTNPFLIKPSTYQAFFLSNYISPRRGPFTGRKVSGFLSTAQENGLGVSNPKYAFA